MEGARADVLIETMRVEPSGDITLWSWHLARLTRSAGTLGFAAVPTDVREQVQAKVSAQVCAQSDAHVNVQVGSNGNGLVGSNGNVQVGSNGNGLVGSKVEATGFVLPQRVRLLFTREGQIDITCAPLGDLALPARARLACDTLGTQAVLKADEPLLRHKATYRPWYTQATDWLAGQDAYFDLLFANERGESCEGSRSNLYVRQDGIWLTPPVESGCLPGTQRAALLAAGHVREAPLTTADVLQAQGTRLSNALRGWFDVTIDPPQAA